MIDREPDEEFPYEHHNKDGSFIYSKKEIGSNEVDNSLKRKIAQQKIDLLLTDKAETRQNFCWYPECKGKPIAWVREIQFDMRGDKVGINQHVVSTSDYDGPVPGFCMVHIANGPKSLAENVYWDRTEIYLGLRPRKWWVIFTDGTKQGGLCKVLNPENLKPSTLDLHTKSSTN
jgi:hypothetical protein